VGTLIVLPVDADGQRRVRQVRRIAELAA